MNEFQVISKYDYLEHRIDELENAVQSERFLHDQELGAIKKLIAAVYVIALLALLVATFIWIHVF